MNNKLLIEIKKRMKERDRKRKKSLKKAVGSLGLQQRVFAKDIRRGEI